MGISKSISKVFERFIVWKSKTRVTSCELRVQMPELRVQIHKLGD